MIKRSAFYKVGGFDEDYFCYFEDVDLCIRLRLAGFRCMYIPDAVVKHMGSASSGGEHNAFSVYYGYRNLVWTYFKNMPFPLLFKYLPRHIYLNCRQIVDFRALGLHRVVISCKIDALRTLPRMLRKRIAIQKSKQITAKSFDQMLIDDR
jgi:GT2 family glycosyltransferase